MSAPKHTPGPWTAWQPIGEEWAVTAFGHPDRSMPPRIANEIDSETDARLIAASPDLLAALERIANPDNYGSDGGWCAESYPDEIARAALAKVGGGT